ncbi:Prolactin [Platysternon megacephalum]|uniref:Prolactin n=1 Tax=Platysternon megacephalum TaxID=55544 RepID=A0A4D9DLM7_9SAUR|nr:Prolactin [Platysternon megacephalum]
MGAARKGKQLPLTPRQSAPQRCLQGSGLVLIHPLFPGYSWLCALLWLLGKPPGAVFVAICARQGDSSCRFLSVSDLFDRVIQHSDRLHSLSTALYLDLEKNFLPNGNELGKWTGKCHTSRMLTPNGKEYVQKIPELGHSLQAYAHLLWETVENQRDDLELNTEQQLVKLCLSVHNAELA